MTLAAEKLEAALQTSKGILALRDFVPGENDPLEFKERMNHRSPAEVEELRADCAALASTGHGFLLIGVTQTNDGTNRMSGVCGVANAADLKRSIEDLLGDGLEERAARPIVDEDFPRGAGDSIRALADGVPLVGARILGAQVTRNDGVCGEVAGAALRKCPSGNRGPRGRCCRRSSRAAA